MLHRYSNALCFDNINIFPLLFLTFEYLTSKCSTLAWQHAPQLIWGPVLISFSTSIHRACTEISVQDKSPRESKDASARARYAAGCCFSKDV